MISALLILFAILAALLAAGVLYQSFGAYRDKRRLPPPGRFVMVDGCRLHLREEGSGSPAVILEAGIAATSLSWSHVQPLVAEFARVVSYDRPGLGWSDSCKTPRTVERMNAELAQLLTASGVPPPYVLVGHSFGGLLIRAFANARPRQVAGLVFVDPVAIEEWNSCSPENARRLAMGAKLSRRGAMLARLGVVRFALTAVAAGGRRLPQSIARASAGKGMRALERLIGEVRKLPAEVLPAVRSHWSNPKSFTAMAEYLESLPACAKSVLAKPIPDVPFVVLSAETATESELLERDAWVKESTAGRHVIVKGTGHWLHLEQPQAVATAIRDVSQTSACL